MLTSSANIRPVISLVASLITLVELCHINTVVAADFTCKGNRIEKGSSIWGYARSAGQDYRIEKGARTIGWIRKAGEYWRIETPGGSSLAWLRNARVETPGGSTLTTLKSIEDFTDCPNSVNAGLWVLVQVAHKSN